MSRKQDGGFAERLQKAAEYARVPYKQSEIGNRLGGVNRQTVDRWMNDNGAPSPDMLFKIADGFGVDARWLATGEGEMVPGARVNLRRLREAVSAAGLGPDGVGKATNTPVGEARQWLQVGNIPQKKLGLLAAAVNKPVDWLTAGSFSTEPPSALDVELHTDILELVESVLEERDVPVAPRKKSEAIATLYDICVASGRADRATVARVLRLVA